MATPTKELIQALRETADRIAGGERYQWSHMGSCNCGHLAQSLTQFTHAEIHASALGRSGDWSEQVIDYCPTSGYTIDSIIDAMLAVGMNTDDIRHLEKLSDQNVLRRFPVGERHLRHNFRDDVVKYIREWAQMLSEELSEKLQTMHSSEPDLKSAATTPASVEFVPVSQPTASRALV